MSLNKKRKVFLFLISCFTAKIHNGDLLYAVKSGNLQLVKNYTKRSNINFLDKERNTPLHLALQMRNLPIAETLIKSGANLDLPNIGGYTSITEASLRGFTDIVKLLLSRRVKLNNQNRYGNTPLMEALIKNHIDIAKLLIKAGANLDLYNNKRKNALDLAREINNHEIVEMIQDSLNKNSLHKKHSTTPTKIILRFAAATSSNPTLNYTQNNSTASSSSNQYSTKTCLICLSNLEQISTKFRLNCGHSFCLDCLKRMVQIASRSIDLEVKCPDCEQEIIERDLVQILTKKDLTSYHDTALKKWLMNNNAKYCPTPNCDYAFINEQNRSELFTCPKCNAKYCTNCLLQHNAQHMTCLEAKRTLNPSEAKSHSISFIRTNTKPCPKCHSPIEKNGGCDHVKCIHCKHEFCYKCYTPRTHAIHNNCQIRERFLDINGNFTYERPIYRQNTISTSESQCCTLL